MKKNLFWLAVQPTPYNKYLYDELKKSDLFDFKLYYTTKAVKDLPWQEALMDNKDRLINNRYLIDWKLLYKALKKDNLFICVGWNTPTKFGILFIRSLLQLPYAFWTDSVKTDNINTTSFNHRLKKFLLKNATNVFTTGGFGVRQMIKSGYYTNEKRLVSLPFFVPIPKVTKSAKKYDIPIKQLSFLTLSRLIERKGLEDGIELISILKKKYSHIDFQLYIGGLGDLKERLNRQIVEKGLERNIHLLGWLDEKEVIKYRDRVDFALHLVSGLDPYPLTVLESLASGLPVIGTSVAGSVVDRVENGVNGYVVPPSNPKAVVAVLKDVIENPVIINTMSEKARQQAEIWQAEKGRNIVEGALKEVL